ncbi:MAG: hypothetical protein UT06_C0042G0003 [Candidatus Woesebacteria bacterium GW2011_GWA1_38_8]|uniref:Uncharacterized protein n=1 Tax=Candidatus Woesebacteria bacterium GW2011_GWA1_38_8 TaxID=1618547 RepID=A0A0G0P016_9BACT|nr:MAG: hypothetical protein UT06_C0042G0003 [Candidatus Woesebacteria bacterium GW2011_GWA1_38_8]
MGNIENYVYLLKIGVNVEQFQLCSTQYFLLTHIHIIRSTRYLSLVLLLYISSYFCC